MIKRNNFSGGVILGIGVVISTWTMSCSTIYRYGEQLERPSAQKLANGLELYCDEFGKEIEWRKQFITKINSHLGPDDPTWVAADCDGDMYPDFILDE